MFFERERILSCEVKTDFLGMMEFKFKSGLNMLTGDNASGKTTILKCICGLSKNQGSVLLDSKEISRKDIAFFFSGDLLGESEMTLRENIIYYVGNKYIDYSMYETLVDVLGLQNHQNVLLKNASEGTKQKMGIMICLLYKSSVVVLDEPFNYLDDGTSKKLMSFLCDYTTNNSFVFVVSTNDMWVVKTFNDIGMSSHQCVSIK